MDSVSKNGKRNLSHTIVLNTKGVILNSGGYKRLLDLNPPPRKKSRFWHRPSKMSMNNFFLLFSPFFFAPTSQNVYDFFLFYFVLCAVCCVPGAVCCVLCAVCRVPCAVCLCAVCCVLCAVCCVLCAGRP